MSNHSELQEKLVSFLHQNRRAHTIGQIVNALSAAGVESTREKVLEELHRLALAGVVRKVRKNRWSYHGQRSGMTGVFQANPRGFGFVLAETGDIFIAPRDTRGAMNGDLVSARVTATRRGKREGTIDNILNRANSRIVGVVERRDRRAFVVPADRRLTHEIDIDAHEATPGDVVEVKITRYPEGPRATMRGRVSDVIGREHQPGIELELLLRMHDLPDRFPDEVESAADRVARPVTEKDIIGRKDYRDRFTVTVDGLDAKDFDDAIACEERAGTFFLVVHIADVSHYVLPSTPLDDEAKRRATSVYLPDRVVPMLPLALSAGTCSLRPGEDRLTMSVEMTIDDRGEVIEAAFHRGVINSDARLTYEEVDQAFASGRWKNQQVSELMERMRRLADILEAKRLRRGSLNFEMPEAKVLLNDDRTPRGVVVRERTTATGIIEEAMIVTNETVASHLYWLSYPCVYRVHERPDDESLAFVESFLLELHYPTKGIRSGHPRSFQRAIQHAKTRPEKILVNQLLLRAMKQARYAADPTGHFGLAGQLYTHFTSPIRRYPDLVVHRLLIETIVGDGSVTPTAERIGRSLPALAEQVSVREREAERAERDATELMIYQLMARDHIGEIFPGIVSGIVGSGFFVELSNLAEGFISFADLTDDYYRVNTDRFEAIGERTRKCFRVGERVMVQVVSVSVEERRMRLVLA